MNKCVDLCVGIFLTTSRMCRNVYVLACMSASCCVGIYVGTWTCQHICQHRSQCVDIYVVIGGLGGNYPRGIVRVGNFRVWIIRMVILLEPIYTYIRIIQCPICFQGIHHFWHNCTEWRTVSLISANSPITMLSIIWGCPVRCSGQKKLTGIKNNRGRGKGLQWDWS